MAKNKDKGNTIPIMGITKKEEEILNKGVIVLSQLQREIAKNKQHIQDLATVILSARGLSADDFTVDRHPQTGKWTLKPIQNRKPEDKKVETS